jgi:hypothetical protein
VVRVSGDQSWFVYPRDCVRTCSGSWRPPGMLPSFCADVSACVRSDGRWCAREDVLPGRARTIFGALLWMADKLKSDQGERARALWAAKGKQAFEMDPTMQTRTVRRCATIARWPIADASTAVLLINDTIGIQTAIWFAAYCSSFATGTESAANTIAPSTRVIAPTRR